MLIGMNNLNNHALDKISNLFICSSKLMLKSEFSKC